MTEQSLDLIWGVEAIAAFIGRNHRQTNHMIQSGHLPMVKLIGGRYCASRQKLTEFFLGEAA